MTQKIGNNLNTLLSSYQIFYQNLRGYHWNIQGKKFFELHLKFEEYYNDVQLKIDEIAERILTLEMIPFHSFSDYIGHSLLKPKTNITDGEIAIMQIREQLTELIKLQKDIFKYADKETDIATSDLMTRYISEQEKTVWMLKSFLS
ncbi:MAG: DNA starvation/stationary phase protection protein [Flavobacteriales bacterium]|nr:DNA starvation/stationary phase protection protein [Flavobacteriales bacterium]